MFYVFTIIVLVVIQYILVFSFYRDVSDYKLVDNIYGYSEDSYVALKELNLDVEEYNAFIDCNVNEVDFKVENYLLYQQVKSCDASLEKLNGLSEFYTNDVILEVYELEFDYNLISSENQETFLQIIKNQKYDSKKLLRYLSYSGGDIVMDVNLNYDLVPYSEYNIVRLDNELVVVNVYNKLTEYNKNTYYCEGNYVYSEEMCNQYELFKNALLQENISMYITKSLDSSDLFCEHATGLAIDIFANTDRWDLIVKIASEYGFIYYVDDRGISCSEVGHFRYVGSVSSQIYELQISLEEYLYKELQN